jgi:hypothetical protein
LSIGGFTGSSRIGLFSGDFRKKLYSVRVYVQS